MTNPRAQFLAILADAAPDLCETAEVLIASISESHPILAHRFLPGWRALNFHHPKAGYVCGVFLVRDHLSLIFEQGRQLSDPEGVLRGNGARVRFMAFPANASVPHALLFAYISEAIALKT